MPHDVEIIAILSAPDTVKSYPIPLKARVFIPVEALVTQSVYQYQYQKTGLGD